MLSRGRAFVYVVACREDNVLKIGFSRDPLQRWRTLHSRFFEFFDLDQGILITTHRVREARDLERLLLDRFVAYQALAPLIVPASAAGHTEWFRGILGDAVHAAQNEALNQGFTLHRPPSAWLRSVLLERKDLMFAWANKLLEMIEFERHNPPDVATCGETAYVRALRDALDAFRSVGLDFTAWVSEPVLRWYAEGRAGDKAADVRF